MPKGTRAKADGAAASAGCERVPGSSGRPGGSSALTLGRPHGALESAALSRTAAGGASAGEAESGCENAAVGVSGLAPGDGGSGGSATEVGLSSSA